MAKYSFSFALAGRFFLVLALLVYPASCLSNDITVSYVSSTADGPPSEEELGQSSDTDIILDEDATLEDYLAYASLHNAAMEAAFNQWQSAWHH